jgi:hypothetical protein
MHLRKLLNTELCLLATALLAVPGASLASVFPVSLGAPPGDPLNFTSGGFQIASADCTGTSGNVCTLSGGPSGSLDLTWSVQTEIPLSPYVFPLSGVGTIASPGTIGNPGTTGFTLNDLLGDHISGSLEWTDWYMYDGNTILLADITPNIWSVGPAGTAALGLEQSTYYLELVTNCGDSACIAVNDPPASILGLEFSNTAFPTTTATPEPKSFAFLSLAFLGIVVARRRRGLQKSAFFR